MGDGDQTPGVHSHLYLYPSENPATPLVSPLLDANNYHSWSRSMLTALSAKNKVEFVDGSAPQPSSSNPLFSAWRRATIWWFLGLYIQSSFLFVIAFYGWIMLMKFGRI